MEEPWWLIYSLFKLFKYIQYNIAVYASFSSLAYTELNRWCVHNHFLREMLEVALSKFLIVLLADIQESPSTLY